MRWRNLVCTSFRLVHSYVQVSDLYTRMYKFPTCTPTAIACENIISYVQVSDLYTSSYRLRGYKHAKTQNDAVLIVVLWYLVFVQVGNMCFFRWSVKFVFLVYKSETCTYEFNWSVKFVFLVYKSETCTYEFNWSVKGKFFLVYKSETCTYGVYLIGEGLLLLTVFTENNNEAKFAQLRSVS